MAPHIRARFMVSKSRSIPHTVWAVRVLMLLAMVSTVLTFGATAGAVTLTIRLMRRERK